MKKGHAWRVRDYKSQVPFGNFKTLERAWEVGEELLNSFVDGDVDRAKGLTAAWMMTLEQVALDGGDWALAWSMLPMPDPTVKATESVVGTMPMSAMATGMAFLRDQQAILDRRGKGRTQRTTTTTTTSQQQQKQQQGKKGDPDHP